MSEAARAVARDRASPEVAGYVEAMTSNAALGWAWCPGLDDRLSVELRLGEQTVARSCADGMREDLARSGIGDGKHAFTLPIPDAMRTRISELRVFAVREDGAAIALETPPPPEVNADRLVHLQRGVDMLIGSQRLLHRNVQAALLQQTPSLTTALADIAAAQAGLQENIATFELFAIRLEEALTAREAPAGAAPARRGLVVATAISIVALLGSCLALCRVMLG